ncbi:MAG: hypothetical protein GX616_05865 [Planctomycetes bacterium]|nr:hypothetical protein [Planctomycetota bacterium]
MCWTAHFAQRVRMATAVAVVLLAGPGLTSPTFAQCPYDWLPGEGIPGVDGAVYDMTSWDPDGAGPRSEVLVVGGRFAVAGDVVARRIACWDPATSAWSALGSGMEGGQPEPYVYALTVLNGRLYAGGRFTTAGGVNVDNVACWDLATSTWLPLGSGVDGAVCALTSLDGKLYVGGTFIVAGGVNANYIACWDPVTSSWSALGLGLNRQVEALTVLDGKLYVAGDFSSAGGISAAQVACWDPAMQTWSALGSGLDGLMRDLAIWDGKVCAAGSFSGMAGVNGASGPLACWDPATQTWSALGSGIIGAAQDIAVLDGKLYAGGSFHILGEEDAKDIVCWDPATSSWSTTLAVSTASQMMYALAVLDGKLYAGGCFLSVRGVLADCVACLDPMTSTWSALGSGMASLASDVLALATLHGKLYAGGTFTTAGTEGTSHIASWDPVSAAWSSLGSGVGGGYGVATVHALSVLNEKVYVGGRFTTAGTVDANRIACWDPATSTWSALGSGMNWEGVHALVVLDGKLYAGGQFTTAGGISAKNIACWDPATSTWSALGSGIGGGYQYVYALAVLGGKLYAGGDFAIAGGMTANRIACWDPVTSTWSALGSGMGGTSPNVYALTVLHGKLYAGGSFTTAGGVNANRIARWDPATLTWSPLGSGLVGTVRPFVHSLGVLDGKVYAGGTFTIAGGASANRIACWDPATSTWLALGAGFGQPYLPAPYYAPRVSALTVLDASLYAGGAFIIAGDQVSAYLARWGPVRAPDDYDCDGVVNASDNCPQIANADQTDADNDGVGDVCDACPNDALNDADGDGVCGDQDQCPGTPAGAPVDAVGCPVSSLESSKPAGGRSLWRNQRNIIRLTFDWDIDSPPAGAVMIQEMLAGGTYGDDLSAGFTFAVENDGQGHPRILKIRENASTLQHRKWYAVRNTGAWTAVAPFTVQYVVQVGDANNDGRVLNTDFGWVNAAIPTFSTADDDRRDINGDGKILNTDFGVLNAHIPSFPVAKPAGH